MLYPRNGGPDRAGIWTKLLVQAVLGGLLAIGILSAFFVVADKEPSLYEKM
jgi:hypothetical protein